MPTTTTTPQKPTATQLARVKADWSKIAGEAVKIEMDFLGGDILAFGSELACLRLGHKFKGAPCKVNYSKNLKTWYFILYAKEI